MLGALAPEICRLYKGRWRLKYSAFSFVYIILSLAYSCLGGGLAVILPATNLLAAFYTGATTDVIISRLIKHQKPQELECSNAFGKTGKWSKVIVGTIQDHADGLF